MSLHPRLRPGVPALGVDVGGTAVKAGVVFLEVRGEVRVLGRGRAPHGGAADGVDGLREAVRAAAARATREAAVDVGAAGIAAAVWLDPATGRASASPHLPALVGTRPADLLPRDAPVLAGPRPVALNDADAAALAEAAAGAARPRPGDVPGAPTVMVALGTGIGGAVLVDGTVLPGAQGMQGELGHLCVVPDGPACPCGARGCWELYASAAALARTLPGRDVRECLDAALAGPGVERDAVDDVGRWLGHGLAQVGALLDPVRVVVGGGLMAAGEVILPAARDELARRLPAAGARRPPELVAAALGNDAGWVGAALAGLSATA